MKTSTFLLLLTLIFSGIQAQDTDDIIIGKKFTIHSDILNEDRVIWISTPTGYESSPDLYPVMYLLDGNGHFHHTTGLIEFMASNEIIPNMVVVGITNTNRTRDMTPPLSNPDSTASPGAGGVDNFIAFIKDELIPYIDSNYRTAPYKIMVGHSLGGLTAVHALINYPDLFNAFIAISPSLWYDNQSFLEPAEKFLDERDTLNMSFFMTMGDEGGNMLGGAMKLAALFEEHPIPGFDHKFVPMPTENHGTIPHRSTYQGLEFIYSDYQPPLPGSYNEFIAVISTIGPEGLLSNVHSHYSKLSKKYGYTVSDEATVNRLGYVFLQENMADAALNAFLQNTANYPKSANAFDSLGDCYRAIGDTTNAKKSYKKAIALANASNHPVGIVSAAKLIEIED